MAAKHTDARKAALAVLTALIQDDHGALDQLLANYAPVSSALAESDYVTVPGDENIINLLGVINGIMAQLGEAPVEIVVSDDDEEIALWVR